MDAPFDIRRLPARIPPMDEESTSESDELGCDVNTWCANMLGNFVGFAIYLCGGNSLDAEDILQDAFIDLLGNFRRQTKKPEEGKDWKRSPEGIWVCDSRAFVSRAIYHRFLLHLRKSKRRLDIPGANEGRDLPDPRPDRDLHKSAERREYECFLSECASALPEPGRTCFFMHYEKSSYQEIAAATGMPISKMANSIRTAWNRVVRCMWQKYGKLS